MHELFTNRAAASRYIASLAAFFLSFSPVARAESTDCAASSPSLSCRLNGVLHWLDAAAVALVLVLIAVIVLAVYLYRKNSKDRPEHR